MSSLRYDYIIDLDEQSKTILQEHANYDSRLPLVTVKIPASAISPDGTDWLHCVEATRRADKAYLRVITNTNRGVNIMLPCNTANRYYKFTDLRFQVRNRDKVMVTFPELYISHSGRKHELYLRASDFKIYNNCEHDVDLDTLGLI